jgi:hypothetical protein
LPDSNSEHRRTSGQADIRNGKFGSPHTFHIPVMGTGFTIDTALRIAKYGISSVASIGDDKLMEKMREFHSEKNGLDFEPIPDRDENSRWKRITAYLNMMDLLVTGQVKELQASPFEPGSDITRYFEMLPDTPLKQMYQDMLDTQDEDLKKEMQDQLRPLAVPGSIDVNIMTKIDFPVRRNGSILPQEYSVALSGFRGFANSTLRSSIVFSAGMNRRLFGYIGEFDDFFPDNNGVMKKKIVLKVSDFRSAILQGKLLAKRGLWVSEYRIESGLNCGGHAFAAKGHLMGPILEEFKQQKDEFKGMLHAPYNRALEKLGRKTSQDPHEVLVTVQGGIGTAYEDGFLLKYYQVDATGWATPFLLVPEVTNVDDRHLQKLAEATEDDVYLSGSSPLGVPFWNLRNSDSEEVRKNRIADGKPGSPCPKGYLMSNTEFTEIPLCPASSSYMKRKLQSINVNGLSAEQLELAREKVVAKSCLCMDLAGGVIIKNNIATDMSSAVCCGPNIENFCKVTSLEKMISHIYGRISLFINSNRPHMFIKELQLYIEHLKQEKEESSDGLLDRTTKYFNEFKQNLVKGIDYYRDLADEFGQTQKEKFLDDLDKLYKEIESLFPSPITA